MVPINHSFGRLSKVIVNQFSDGVTQSVYLGLLNFQIEVARQVLCILLPQLNLLIFYYCVFSAAAMFIAGGAA